MHLVKFRDRASGQTAVGLLAGDKVAALEGLRRVADALRLPLTELRARCAAARPDRPLDGLDLLPPVDGRTDVWAAGVTYTISKQARMAESLRAAGIYEQVYAADRPELFFKSAAWRVATHDEPIAVREDSEVDVPEPELAVVVNSTGEIVGYLVCNDVSSRTIEGENPLYLPQAKMYLGACALTPGIRPVWEVPDPYALPIKMCIDRAGETIWEGTANTGQLHRKLPDLVAYLHRADVFPDGVVLATGTCLVPPMPFSLRAGDVVTIDIETIGRLRNTVVKGVAGMLWLLDDPQRGGT